MERTFIPGSRWLYFKLYTGLKSADDVLVGCVFPLARRLVEAGLAGSWFFIRYADPEHHLRLRLRIDRPEHYGAVMRTFYEAVHPAVESGLVTRVMCDTYHREIERYGASGIEPLEDLFCADSAAVAGLLGVLSELPTDLKEEARWKLALRLGGDALAAFGCDLAACEAVADRLAKGFRAEFGFVSHAYTVQLNDRFRASRSDVRLVLSGSYVPLEGCTALLEERAAAFGSVAARLRGLQAAGSLEVPIDDLLGSILHMTMNRLFKSHNRLYELVIYDFMSRHYKSAAAVAALG